MLFEVDLLPPDNTPVPIDPPGWLESSLGHLSHIPAALGALGRLVGKTADIGTAWLDVGEAAGQRAAQRIRDDQDARTAAVKVLSAAVGAKAASDPAVVERALGAWIDDRLRKQTNREAVAEKTVEMLKDDPPAADAPGPSEDWMNVFAEHAEKASSEQLRYKWARILAGEIRQRGTVSLRTVQFVSILDQELAMISQKVAGFIIENSVIPQIKYFDEGDGFRYITLLESLGLIVRRSAMVLKVEYDGPLQLSLADDKYIVFEAKAQKTYHLKGSTISDFGREVFSLFSVPADKLLLEAFDEVIKPLIEPDAKISTF